MSPRPTRGDTAAANTYLTTLSIAEAVPASSRPTSIERVLALENIIPENSSIGTAKTS